MVIGLKVWGRENGKGWRADESAGEKVAYKRRGSINGAYTGGALHHPPTTPITGIPRENLYACRRSENNKRK